MPHKKMLPPLPVSDESELDRFKRFAKAILAVPKPEIETSIHRTPSVDPMLEERLNNDANLKTVQRDLAKRRRRAKS